MAVEDDRDADEFEQDDLDLSPEMHQVQAEMAAERGEPYDPYEFEHRVRERVDDYPDPLEAAEPLEGKEELFEEWLAMGERGE